MPVKAGERPTGSEQNTKISGLEGLGICILCLFVYICSALSVGTVPSSRYHVLLWIFRRAWSISILKVQHTFSSLL